MVSTSTSEGMWPVIGHAGNLAACGEGRYQEVARFAGLPGAGAAAEGGRCPTEGLPEHGGEVAVAGEAEIEGDLGQLPVCFEEKVHCASEPDALQVLVHRHPDLAPEDMRQVMGGAVHLA